MHIGSSNSRRENKVIDREKNLDILIQLGLTKLQAKVYLTLTKLGKTSVKTISDTTKIDRAQVYQVIAKLQEIGLIQKILATPILFKPISLQEGMQILLERKAKEFSDIEEKTIKIIQKNRENKIENPFQNNEDQFMLIPGKETHNREFIKLFENTQTRYDGIFMRHQDFCWCVLGDGKDGVTSKLLDKGVKIRLIVCNPENKSIPEDVSKIVRYINKKGTYRIKYTKLCAAAMFGIIDDKAVFMHVGSESEWMEKPTGQFNAGTLGGIWWPGVTNGQILNYVTENQYGGIPFLWGTASSTWSLYDAFTGNWILNLANASTTSPNFVTDSSGALFVYLIGDSWIAMWNSTKAIPMSTTIPGYRTWRPLTGSTTDWRNGIQWNVTLTTPIPGQSIAKVGDIILATSSRGAAPGTRIEAGYSITTGEQLWVQNRTILTPGSNNFGLQGPMADGVYALFINEKQAWYGFSTQTGNQLWGPTQPTSNAWSMYNNGGIIAYGRLYSLALDGLHVYNLTTGEHLWDFSVVSGLQTIYGVYPFELGGFTIADEKVYIAAGHSHGILPQYTNDKMYVINAITGELVFDVLGWMQCGWTNPPAIADGILVTQNGYDNQIYAFGKGLSETTISASPITITSGSPTTIQGTVTDQSPGQTCLGIPAAGTPAISDESMSRWMEHLYMQQPKPTNATGVPVTLTATDQNGETITIGTVTSDASGNYAIQWTPPSLGIYKITATFAGTNSYWPSNAEMAVSVANAPESQASPTPTSQSTTTPTESITPSATATSSPTVAPQPDQGVPTETLLIIGAAVVIIAVVVAAAVLLRKRQ